MWDCASLLSLFLTTLLLMNEPCCHIPWWHFFDCGHVRTKVSDDNWYLHKTPSRFQLTHARTHAQECGRTGQQSWRAGIPDVCPHCAAFLSISCSHSYRGGKKGPWRAFGPVIICPSWLISSGMFFWNAHCKHRLQCDRRFEALRSHEIIQL